MVYEDEDNFDEEVEENDSEEQVSSGQKGEEDKIPLVEKILLVLITGSADLFEVAALFAVAVPVIGWVTWGVALLFGAMASTIVFLWSFLRGTRGNAKMANAVMKRTIIILAGGVVGEVIPFARTASFLLAVWMHDHATLAEKLNPTQLL